MLKRKVLATGVVAALLVLLTGCGSLPGVKPGNNSHSTNKPTATKTVKVTETNQYTIPQEVYGGFATNGTSTTEPTYLFPAFYTADQYIKNSFDSSYLFSGQLSKDEYSLDWAKDNVYEYFSVDYAKQFEKMTKSAADSKSMAAYQATLYTQDTNYQVIGNCTAKADLDYCRFPAYSVQNASYVYNSPNDVQLNITVLVNPIYQKPDSAEGNSVTQTQKYNLHFTLSFANAPTSKDTKKPIMVITNLTSSLEIQSVQDYSVNRP